MTRNLACVGLGSNLGNREERVTQAIQALACLPGCELDKCSTLYETPAWGFEQQPSFINAVCGLYSELPAMELLKYLQEIERQHKRERAVKWGPRTLDLDIICYGDQRHSSPELSLPHPHFKERVFVLRPLAEIYPDLIIDGLSVQEHLQNLSA